jgi:hypothetical protein
VLVNGSTFTNNTGPAIAVSAGRVQATSDAFEQAIGVQSQVGGQIVWASTGSGMVYTGPTLNPASNDSTAGAPAAGRDPSVVAVVSSPPLSSTQPYAPSGCTAVVPASGQSLAAAINAAITSGPGFYCAAAGTLDSEIDLPSSTFLLLGPGVYPQTASIVVSGSGGGVLGTSSGTTVLQFAAGAHGANIRLANGVTGAVIRDLQLTRETTDGVVGDAGVYGAIGEHNEQNLLENLAILREFDGLYLNSTSGGWIRNVESLQGTRDGLLITDSGIANGAGAYTLDEIFAGFNGEFGILLSPDGGSMQMAPWTGVLGFNDLGGMIAATDDSGGQVEGLNVSNAFLGEDGSNGNGAEVAVMSGTNHSFYQVYVEDSGQGISATASGTPGMYFAAGVGSVQVRASIVSGSTGVGIATLAQSALIEASFVFDNGSDPASGSPAVGVDVGGGSADFIADYFANDDGTQPVAIDSASPIDASACYAENSTL